ncbi:MAG: hypothetical protein LBQ18_00420, partial [Campylobacteraceae bacterium]|nr:hypothetical protein [Campylobacteraceae bacterium]
RIDFTIPKLNELWEIESVSAKHPFEGKWADCFYRDGALVCGTYFTVEQGDNVCNADWYRANKDDYYIAIALYKRQNGHIKPVKFCDENGADSYEYTGCDIYEDGYDKQGRKTYRTGVPFADWEIDDDKSTKWGQSFRQPPSFSTTLKTPFLPNEREGLIQTNKWLQDCLNYKGE